MIHARDIAAARLVSQQIAGSRFTTMSTLVDYMGAMQAQDYAMAKWAIGLRVPGSTDAQVEKSLDKGEIIRIHVLRPTWHIIAAADVYWMLAISSGKIKALMKTMDKQLGLTEKIFTKSNAVIEKALGEGQHLTREQLQIRLNKAKISTRHNRLAHLLERAELEMIACSGVREGNQRTYALLAERVPLKKTYSREESLAMLATKYFTSRGPATLADFCWWSGLLVTEARHALEMVKEKLLSETAGEKTFWFDRNLKWPVKTLPSLYLLPAFDEFIIGYKDRSASLPEDHQKKVLTVNGIFYPVVVENGQATGVWKRTVNNKMLSIQTSSFRSQHTKAVLGRMEKQAKYMGKFLSMKTTLSQTV